MFTNEPTLYPFTAAERARLAAYRAAVRAGLYSDHEGADLLWTPAELRRLVAYWAAVRAGLYGEQVPPHAQ